MQRRVRAQSEARLLQNPSRDSLAYYPHHEGVILMTVSLLRNLALGLATVAFAACTSSGSNQDTTTTTERTNEVTTSDNTARENMREGWQDVKEGTEQAATGVGQKTKEAAR